MQPKKWLIGSLLLMLGLLAWVGTLQAQGGYNHAWFSVNGSGATISAGDYTLTGVGGQPEAGQLNAGGYTLTGGMLALPAATPTQETPEETPESSLFLPRLNR